MHIGLFVQENTSLTSLPMKTYLTCGLFPTWVREKQLVAQLTLSHMKFPLGLLVPLHPSGRPLIPSRGITFPHTFSCIFLLVAGPGNAWVTGLEVLGHVSSPAGWQAHVKLELGPSPVIQVGPLRSTCLNTHCAHILQHLPPFLCFEVSAVFLCYSKGYTGCLVFHPYCKPVKRLQQGQLGRGLGPALLLQARGAVGGLNRCHHHLRHWGVASSIYFAHRRQGVLTTQAVWRSLPNFAWL